MKICEIALKEVGTKEKGVNNVKYNTWYYGKAVDGGSNQAYAWCAAFVSWCANQAGVSTSIIPKENYCPDMVKFFKEKGCFKKKSEYTPKAGDIIFFDWNNNNAPDHVGIVIEINESGKVVTVEGNSGDAVKKKTYSKGNSTILGYGVPQYEETHDEPKEEPKPSKVNQTVLAWQNAAIKDGYKFPKYGADGEWGSECEGVAKIAICKKYISGYKNKNLTKIVQKKVGATVDGLFGSDTQAAVKGFQKKNGLTADGIVGIKTWKKILGV